MDALLARRLHRLAGLATRRELLAAGVTQEAIVAAWRDGMILRIRHGLYGWPDLPEAVIRAQRVGGVVAAMSACALLDLWEPPGSQLTLDVSVRPNAKSLRDPDSADRPLDRGRSDVRVLHDGDRIDRRSERRHVGIENCLRQTIGLSEPAVGLAVLDSALHRHGLTGGQLDRLGRALPARRQIVLARASASAESGSESIMRWGLIEAGLVFESQRWISESIRVDFLVERRVVVECTSYAFHSSPRDYERDRARIAAAVREGFVVLEFTHHQIVGEWEMVLRTILAAVVRG